MSIITGASTTQQSMLHAEQRLKV